MKAKITFAKQYAEDSEDSEDLKHVLQGVSDEYEEDKTQLQSKQLMRYLINHYLGDKPLNSKKLFTNIQDN